MFKSSLSAAGSRLKVLERPKHLGGETGQIQIGQLSYAAISDCRISWAADAEIAKSRNFTGPAVTVFTEGFPAGHERL
jgi:hypothetical protein